jgi:cytochrome c peroxidase
LQNLQKINIMKKILCLSACAVFLFAMACNSKKGTDQSAQGQDSAVIIAKSTFAVLPSEAINPENAVTPEKVLLGKTLYFENRLSMHNTQSCNTCHNLATFGVDNKATSTGDLGKNGGRNSPTTLNAALHIAQFWDGRMKDVEEQAGGPMMNPVEMNMPTEKEVIARLSKLDGYKKMFAAAFPGEKEPINFKNVTLAIAAFERTLLTPSRFDQFLGGDDTAITHQEMKGMVAFMDAGCTTCHNGALLGGNMFQKFPLIGEDYKTLTGSTNDDKGKMEVTKNEADKYIFKVPSLRNIAETGPYFHDGSVADLNKAITIMAKLQVGKDLTYEQASDIAVFLKSLSGNLPADAMTPPVMP